MTHDETVARYQRLKARQEELERKRIECQVRLENLREEYKKILTQLKTDYNVSTLEEGKALRDKMQADLTTKMDELDANLSKFEQALASVQNV